MMSLPVNNSNKVGVVCCRESPESVFEVYMEVVHPSSHSSGKCVKSEALANAVLQASHDLLPSLKCVKSLLSK